MIILDSYSFAIDSICFAVFWAMLPNVNVYVFARKTNYVGRLIDKNTNAISAILATGGFNKGQNYIGSVVKR